MRVLLPLSLTLLAVPLAALAAAPPRGPAPKKPAQQPAAAPAPSAFAHSVQPLFAKHCGACHNPKNASGGLDLQVLASPASLKSHRASWEQVAAKLRTGEMPPKGAPRPPAAQVQAVTGWIEGELDRIDRTSPPDPGRVTARRLNRAEYDNTVRDLLGVDLHPAEDFPQDDSGYGFDNIGDVLSVSPVLMEKYLAAAEKVTRAALFGPEKMKPVVVKLRPASRAIVPDPKPRSEYDETGLTLPNALHATYRFPVEGEYQFRLGTGGERPRGSAAVRFAVWIDGQQVQTFDWDPEGGASFSPDRQDFNSKSRDVRVRVPAGQHWIAASILRLYEGLPPSYGGPNPSTKPTPPPPEIRIPPFIPPDRVEEFKKRIAERRTQMVPANEVRVSSLEISGPFAQATGPSEESLRRVFTCGHLRGGHGPACARKVAGDFARRAFRRPLAAGEVDPYVRLVSTAQSQGDSFEEGVALALQAVLVSPHFLFRIERNDSAAASQPLSPHELATRLSYFLWSSTPDDALSRCADSGTLKKPEVLAAQVRRMLKDPKSRALVENFGGQWLELRKLESVKPDRERFPNWDEYLRLSIREETERFLEHLVREDGSLLDLIDGKYTYLNERLAQFYGLPGVKGPEFRRVDLAGTPRGGILTQASILTVSSYSTRTSPVLRGKWILENVLNAPPPPPPPDVPNLEETKVGPSASLRQQLEQHRQNPTCASCHNRLDPLGFALENFDAIGAWRDKDGSVPVDNSASLPDGRTFQGPDGLRATLRGDRPAFARCVTEKLLTYALGRGLESYDRPVVKKIAGRLTAGDDRFSTLVLEIVNSVPFQMRRGDRRT